MSKSQGSRELLSERDLSEEIAKVAYDLYKKRGMGDGYDFDDWLKAEKIVSDRYGKLKREEIDLMSKAAAETIATKKRPRNKQKTL